MHHRYRPSYFSYFLLIAVIFFMGWQASGYYHSRQSNIYITSQEEPRSNIETSNEDANQKVDLSLMFHVWDIVKNNYVDEDALDDKEQIYGAIGGLVNSLEDPYTVFMTPSQTQEFQKDLEGKLEGIGAELTVEDKNLVIVSPLKGSPAEQAGLKPGDIIYKINDEIAAEMNFFEAIMSIRGEKGTTVTLTIFREGKTDPFEVTIVRDSIKIESVSYEKKEENIAYISINQFTDTTITEFQKAASEILLWNPKGLILDLRYNGGGYLDIAVDILGELIKGKKQAVNIKHRDALQNESMYLDGKGRLSEIPLVVLVNNGSASASEIVAGAIQDHKRGFIIGEQTFGKGSVQEVEMLDDGSSLRLTIAKWFTPNNRTIDHVGITPDRVVELTEEDVLNGKDPQMEAALEYFKNF